MAKFKAGQGAGCAGMLMGAAQGLRRRGAGGGRGLCVPLSCAAASTRKPPYGEAMGLGCPVQQGVLGALVVLGGIWVAGGLTLLRGLVLMWGIGVNRRKSYATGSRLVLSRCYGATGVANGYYWENWCYGGDAKGGAGPRLCSAHPGRAPDLGAQQRTQLGSAWCSRPGQGPPYTPSFPRGSPLPG